MVLLATLALTGPVALAACEGTMAQQPSEDAQATADARTDGSTLPADGSTLPLDGSTLPPDGSVSSPDAGPQGDTFYIATDGDDTNPCSSSARCATVAGVMSKPTFGPGDTILIGDGTYTNPSMSIDCADDPARFNGTASEAILVEAENERQAHLTSANGGYLLSMRNCTHWSFEGLHFSQADFATSTGDGIGRVYDSEKIGFKRNLVSRNNLLNTSSSGGVLFYNTPSFIVEDNEFYNYRRHAVATKYQHTGGIFRRNYCNPRGQGAVGTCFSIYPGSNIIVEDNIVESNPPVGFDSMPFGHDNENNRWLGNIGVDVAHSLVLLKPRCDGNPDGATLAAVVRDNLTVGGAGRLLYSRSSQVQADHNSAFGGTNQGFVADQETCAPASNVFEVVSSLALNNGYGFYASADVAADTFTLDQVAAFGNGTSFYPASHPGITGAITTDPQMETARVCVPTTSPLHGAAPGGGDIGANVLYRYENGVKTEQKRWVTTKPASCPTNSSGIYPFNMRACVPGVNDAASTSLAGIADRLNMTTTQVEVTCGEGAGYFP